MMDFSRNLLFIALLFVSFLIWHTWESDLNQIKNKNKIIKQTDMQINGNTNTYQSDLGNSNRQDPKLITVKTNVLKLQINTIGGDIYEADLLVYPKTLHSTIPFRLLETSREFVYQAQSGLIGRDGPDNPDNNNGSRPLYLTNKNHFILQDGQDELRVPLTFASKYGVVYQKVYIFKRDKYHVSVEYNIYNNSMTPLSLAFFGQLKQTITRLKLNTKENSDNFALHTYRGAAYSSNEDNYRKYSFSDILDHDLNINTKSGWIAMLQQYFAVVWIPSSNQTNTFYTLNIDKSIAIIGYKSSPIKIASQSKGHYISTLWIGPELQSEMSEIAPYLDLTVDYGWLWFLSQPLFKLLKFIHSFVGNWGVSIILITFIVRGIMYPLTKAQYTSIAKIRLLQPKLTAIKNRISEDKQRINQEIINLYKAEKVNPLGGCLPLLIQMPIFIALYGMLMSSVELRHASFIAWIQDLSAQDPYYILPVLMGLTMYFIQKLSTSTIDDPTQQKIVNYLPVIFTLFFLWFPSGLVLYYIISNLVTIIQQQIIYRGLKKDGLI